MHTSGKPTAFKLSFEFARQVDVRFRAFAKTSLNDFEWLADSADLLNEHDDNDDRLAFGIDTEFDNQEIALIQIATHTRCLLIYVTSKDRRNHRNVTHCKPFKKFLLEKSFVKFGAELWFAAV